MKLSIVTPTYNRAALLPRCYQSLCLQTIRDFEWIIIDDGSTDDTAAVVHTFSDDRFPIIYVKKENGGKHTALNESHCYIHGEVVLILDSDDYLSEDAVETVIGDWERYRPNEQIACISYYKLYDNGDVVAGKMDTDYYESDHISYRVNKNIQGDQCETVRAEVFKEFVFPVYAGEKFASEGLLWNYIGFHYRTVYRDKGIYICEYQPGGISHSGKKLLMRNPKAMIDLTKTFFDNRVCLSKRIKETWLYIVYSFCDKRDMKQILDNSSNKRMVFTQLPIGWLLFQYWKRKYL